MAGSSKRRSFGSRSTALQVLDGVDLSGRTVLITGANSGIGFETARALAIHGAHVVFACRNKETAQEAMKAIHTEKADAKLDFVRLECSELRSAEECAAEYLFKGWPLHVLILNAGVYGPPHRVTDDGFEATFQVNHLTQFYLTQLLLDKVVQSAPSRIVLVSSDAHKLANITPTTISWETLSPTHKNGLNSSFAAYGISKLCNILFGVELHQRLKDKNVIVTSLMPGVIKTNILRSSSFAMNILVAMMGPFRKTQEQGAATTVYCAVAEEIERHSGEYFKDCKPTAPDRRAYNNETATKLWAISEEMIQHYKESVAKVENQN